MMPMRSVPLACACQRMLGEWKSRRTQAVSLPSSVSSTRDQAARNSPRAPEGKAGSPPWPPNQSGKQRDLDEQRAAIIGRQAEAAAVGKRQLFRPGASVHEGEHVDGRLVALQDRRAGRIEHAFVAEILEQQEAGLHVGSADFGRAQPGLP